MDTTDIKNDEGKILNKDGKPVAVYKDAEGKIHSISAVCTHMGCTVGWNNQDKTWDCPCHGSRYDKVGKVINGPSTQDLPEVSLE